MSAATARRRSPLGRVMLAVTAVAAGVLTGVGPTPPALAVAPDGTSSFATYNMQGSTDGLRWTQDVAPLARRYPVVLLQEAGSGPPPTPGYADAADLIRVQRPPNLPRAVYHTLWQAGGGAGALRHVYFLQTDPQRIGGRDLWQGGRVNLAVVTDTPADEVRVVENPLYDPNGAGNAYRMRPLLGVRFGTTWYYDAHARGVDVQALLGAVRAATPAGHQWVVGGDFNLDIRGRTTDDASATTLRLQGGETLLRTGAPTHQSGGELDYAIAQGLPAFTASLPQGRGSDHYPVLFDPVPVQPAPQPVAPVQVYPSVLASTNGLQLDLADGTVTVNRPGGSDNQRFDVLIGPGWTHAFRNVRSGTCIGLPRVRRRDVPQRQSVMVRECTDPDAQWTAEDPDAPGGPVVWRSATDPFLCLDAPAVPGVLAGVSPCTASPSQRWWGTATEIAERAWTTTDERIAVRSAQAGGGYLDVGRGNPWDNSPVITHERKDVDNQFWSIEAVDPGDNLVRLRPRHAPSQCLDVRDSDRAMTQGLAVIYRCEDPGSKNDGRGHRWRTERYADGSVRFRNEATHLCLLAPSGVYGVVTVRACDDSIRQRWFVVSADAP